MSGKIVLVFAALNILLVHSAPTLNNDNPVTIQPKQDVEKAKQVQQALPLSAAIKARQEQEAEFLRQAQNARYQFATEMIDNIYGNFQQRAEIREGTKVYGKYSYDDGFAWRTVYYVADEDGYRIIKEEVLPSHMTAHIDGDVNVQTFNNGNSVNYHITRKDMSSRN